MKLRRQIERVAEKRRALPPGGKIPQGVREQQEFKDGEEWDMPILNVFKRDGDEIRHFWGSELLYVPPEPGQEYRHNDLLDLVPAARGDFHPKLKY